MYPYPKITHSRVNPGSVPSHGDWPAINTTHSRKLPFYLSKPNLKLVLPIPSPGQPMANPTSKCAIPRSESH